MNPGYHEQVPEVVWIEGRSRGDLRTWTMEGERRPGVCELPMMMQTLYVCLDDASVYAELADAQAAAIAAWGQE